ncbi:MAG: ubiquinone biosynthesis regulatory protein kinase UbiB, partial [Motiliproteus sp.]
PLKDISFGQVLLGLFQTARRFNMEVQPQLVLLQKTLLNIEGLGRQLYPDLDLWQTAKPFLESWMKQRMGVRGLYRGLKTHAPEMIEQLPQLPQLLHDALTQLKQLDQGQKASLLGRHNRQSKKVGWRIHWGRVGGVLALIAAACSADLLPDYVLELPVSSWLWVALALLLLSAERQRV